MNRNCAVPKFGHYKQTLAFRLDAELVQWFDAQAKRLSVSRSSIMGYALPMIRQLVEAGVLDLVAEKRRTVRANRRSA